VFSDGNAHVFPVAAQEPDFRLQNVGYLPDRKTVYLYVERMGEEAALPASVLLDGEPVEARWLSECYVGRLRTAVVTLDAPLVEGAWHVWTISGGVVSVSSGLRVFAEPACLGTYGHGDIARIRENDLDMFVSFGQLSREWLDKASAGGIAGSMHVHGGEPPEPVRGHPAVYGYVLRDEPDVGDYNAKDRPIHQRIGSLAPQLVNEARQCAQFDPEKPAIINLDLTFTPANYYVYAPIADFTTGDCYPVTIGKPLTFLRDCVTTLKRAAAPKPIGFIYQGSWEHFARKNLGRYVGAGEIRAKGSREFVDPARVRGFGRPPVPEEIKMQMVYCLGAGARGLFSFIDATEAAGGLVIIGSCDLPEIWATIGEVSRNIALLREDINLGHPIAWAECDAETLWVRTLVCGEESAIVAVVNEDGVSDETGLVIQHARDVTFSFEDLPWLRAEKVVQMWGTSPQGMFVRRTQKGAQWCVPAVYGATLFRVSAGDE
jgi:hypothetical protein